jgi:hypothetical protein
MAVLETLAQELGLKSGELRHSLSAPAPDAAQSAFITTQPDGGIAAVFPGGVRIPAEPVTPYTPDRRIQWVNQTDGSLVAEVFSQTSATINEAHLAARTQSNPARWSEVYAFGRNDGTGGVVARGDAPTGGYSKIIIGGAGNSDFLLPKGVFAFNAQGGSAQNVNIATPWNNVVVLMCPSGFVDPGYAAVQWFGYISGVSNPLGTINAFQNNANSHGSWQAVFAAYVGGPWAAGTYQFGYGVNTPGYHLDSNDNFCGFGVAWYS